MGSSVWQNIQSWGSGHVDDLFVETCLMLHQSHAITELTLSLPPQGLPESSFRNLLVKEKLRDLKLSMPITSVILTSSTKGNNTIWVFTLHGIPPGGWMPQGHWLFSVLFFLFLLILGISLMHTWYFGSHWLAAGKQLATWQGMANQSAPLEGMHLIQQLQNVIAPDIYISPSKTHAQPQSWEAFLSGFFPSVLGFSGTICYLGFFTMLWWSFRKLTCKRWRACPLLHWSGLRAGLAFPPERKFAIAQIHSCVCGSPCSA